MKKLFPILMTVVFACSASVSRAQLLNTGFETPGGATTWDSWINFNNAVVETGASHTGGVSVKAYGNGGGDYNVSGVFQQLPTTASQPWEGSVWVYNPAADAIQGQNFAVLNIEWIDNFGTLINFVSVRAADAATPTNTWTRKTITAVAPAGTAFARLVLLHVQAPGLLPGAVLFDDAELVHTTLPNGPNPSFEIPGTGGASLFLNWTNFGNVFADGSLVKTGATAAKMFGNFTGGENASGVFKQFTVNPGETWVGHGWVGTLQGDRISGANFAALNIEWRDMFGSIISFETARALDAASAPGIMHEVTVTGVAPPGATLARIVALHIQPALAGGAVWWDDVEATLGTSGCDSIDFNNDGVSPDSQDITDFLSVFGGGTCSNDPNCNDIDFNNDGVSPDSLDVDSLLSVFGGGPCL